MDDAGFGGGMPGGGDRVCELLTGVLGALGEAAGVRGWDGSAEVLRERVRLAQRVLAVAEAVRLGVLRQVQARPEVVPNVEGGKAAAAVLVNSCRVDARQAKKDVAAAEACDPDGGGLPLLGAALAAGDISRAHVEVAVGALSRLPVAVKTRVLADGRTGLAWIDAFLVEHCRRHPPGTIRALVREMVLLLDPDRADDLAEGVKRRGLRFRNDAATGMVVGSFALDPAEGAAVVAALEALAAPAPTGTARTRDGDTVPVADARSRPQRLADALGVLAEIAMATPSPHPRPGCGAGAGAKEGVVGRRARADLSVVASWEQMVAAGLAPALPASVQAAAAEAAGAAVGLARMGLAGGGDRPGRGCRRPRWPGWGVTRSGGGC